MRLVCFTIAGEPPKIISAPTQRTWMDQASDSFAYRCLPLNIANAHGWLILNTVPFTATWTGGAGLDAVLVQPCAVDAPLLAQSHFGFGVLTFHVNALFRTDQGYDLMVTGPMNQPKDAIQPLSGIVETDWTSFTFTMNWKFTRKMFPITFERDEPFCMIFPMKRGLIEDVDPVIRSIENDKEIEAAYRAYARDRIAFNEGLAVPRSDARLLGWQKDYFRGTTRLGLVPSDHHTKLKLKEFKVMP